jgi:hypothetical protein
VLTLSGTDTLANYQAALESVTYQNTSNNPSPNIRRITFTVNDGTYASESVDQYLKIVSPISYVTPTTSTFIESGLPVDAALILAQPATSLGIINLGMNGNITTATVKIDANYVAGQDVLQFTNTGFITGVFNASTGTLTLSGTGTYAQYQAALRSVTYDNLSSSPTPGIRRFAFSLNGATNPAYVADRYMLIS